MIPRGGTCRSCHKYVLWGDVVRGCFRRRTSDYGTSIEQSAIVVDAEQDCDHDRQGVFNDELDKPSKPPRKRILDERGTPTISFKKVSKKNTVRKKIPRVVPLEGEFFDLDAISGSDSEESEQECDDDRREIPEEEDFDKRPKYARKRKSDNARGTAKISPKIVRKIHRMVPPEEGEFFDLDAISGSDSSSTRRPHASKKIIIPLRSRGRPLAPGTQSKPKSLPALRGKSSHEFFDIDEFTSTDSAAHDSSPRRKAKSNFGTANGLAGPLVSISTNLDITVTAPGRSMPTHRPLKHNQKLGNGDCSESHVIQISD